MPWRPHQPTDRGNSPPTVSTRTFATEPPRNKRCAAVRSFAWEGVVPAHWPAPIEGVYCGYAGGLGPDTLQEPLEKIATKVGDRTIWIDMETRTFHRI